MVIAKNLKEDIIKQLETQALAHIPASEEDYFPLNVRILKSKLVCTDKNQ